MFSQQCDGVWVAFGARQDRSPPQGLFLTAHSLPDGVKTALRDPPMFRAMQVLQGLVPDIGGQEGLTPPQT